MGLAERRAVADFQQKLYPDLKKKVDEAAGFTVDMEVKWNTLEAEGYASSYPDMFEKVYFQTLIDVFKSIAVDDMSKEALKSGLKKVIIDGSSGYRGSGCTFDNGVLLFLHKPEMAVEDLASRVKALKELLEAKL